VGGFAEAAVACGDFGPINDEVAIGARPTSH
jgi:hypothetical protein